MRRQTFRSVFLCLATFLCVLAAQAQQSPSLEITGDIQKPVTLTAADLAAMKRVTVTVGGAEYQGVLLDDVVARAGVSSGSTLRGKALGTAVLAEAKDGYKVAFSLGELDPIVTDNQIVLADTKNGKPLPAEEAPFRVVIPKDNIGARSIRMVTRLTIVQFNK
jgi:DMSO/TMAO reductase YedYZ molybdopterin-dependent catalytic subunit